MIYTREKLEILADSINQKYFPERLKSAIRLDGYGVIFEITRTNQSRSEGFNPLQNS